MKKMMITSVWNLVEIDNEEDKEDHTYYEKNQDVTGAAASSEVPTDGTAKKSEPGDTTSIHPRENEEAEKKEKKSLKRDEEDMLS